MNHSALVGAIVGTISASIIISIIAIITAVMIRLYLRRKRERVAGTYAPYDPVLHSSGNHQTTEAKKQPLMSGFKMKANECYRSTLSNNQDSVQFPATLPGVHSTSTTRGEAEDMDTEYSYPYVNPQLCISHSSSANSTMSIEYM